MKECCKKNRKIIEQNESITVTKCSVCGVKHYRMKAETGHIGATINRLGN